MKMFRHEMKKIFSRWEVWGVLAVCCLLALAAFAAAGVSGGDPMKTGWTSVKLAVAGFIIPYIFVLSPQLMLINTTLAEGVLTTVTARPPLLLCTASMLPSTT